MYLAAEVHLKYPTLGTWAGLPICLPKVPTLDHTWHTTYASLSTYHLLGTSLWFKYLPYELPKFQGPLFQDFGIQNRTSGIHHA